MTIIVTGGAGFIGSNYMHYVVNKYPNDEFVCLDALTYAGNYNNIKELEGKPNYKFVKMDIRDEEAVNKLFDEEKFNQLDNLNKDLLIAQLKAMEAYVSILSIRIGLNSQISGDPVDEQSIDPVTNE